MAVQRFHVSGSSPLDEKIIEDTLRALPGVLYATVSPRARFVEVDFDDDVIAVETMIRAVEPVGVLLHLAG
jgi:hypothetical protein